MCAAIGMLLWFVTYVCLDNNTNTFTIAFINRGVDAKRVLYSKAHPTFSRTFLDSLPIQILHVSFSCRWHNQDSNYCRVRGVRGRNNWWWTHWVQVSIVIYKIECLNRPSCCYHGDTMQMSTYRSSCTVILIIIKRKCCLTTSSWSNMYIHLFFSFHFNILYCPI